VVIPNSAVTEGTIRALNDPHALEAVGAGELLDQMIRHAAPSFGTAPPSSTMLITSSIVHGVFEN
jgi:hypothetical protein